MIKCKEVLTFSDKNRFIHPAMNKHIMPCWTGRRVLTRQVFQKASQHTGECRKSCSSGPWCMRAEAVWSIVPVAWESQLVGGKLKGCQEAAGSPFSLGQLEDLWEGLGDEEGEKFWGCKGRRSHLQPQNTEAGGSSSAQQHVWSLRQCISEWGTVCVCAGRL